MERATLHNEDDIRRKDIRPGDDVILQRAGDVIPQVVGPVTTGETDDAEGRQVGREERHVALPEWTMPRTCPACGSETVRETGEVAVRCPNRSCPAQLVESIKHFVSKGAMDIEGIGEETVVLLHEQGLIGNVADLYDLEREHFVRLEDGKLVNLPLFGAKTRKGEDGALEIVEAKRADKVLAAIEQSKGRPFARVLFALGIRHVGGVTAQALVEQLPEHGRAPRRRRRRPRGGARASARWSPRRSSSSSATSTIARPSRSCAPPGCASSKTPRRGAKALSPARPSCSPASCPRSRAARPRR